MKTHIYLIAIVISFFLSGCVQNSIVAQQEKPKKSKAQEYNDALFAYAEDDANQENLILSTQKLKDLIDEYEQNKKKVPPAMYSNYGYLLYISGKPDSAREYFIKEVTLYPQSKKFIQQIVDKLYMTKEDTKDKNKDKK